MAIAAALVAQEVTRAYVKRTYKLTFSGNYATNGDTLDLSAATNPKGIANAKGYGSDLPAFAYAPHLVAGYTGELVKGATNKVHKLVIYSTAKTQHTAAGYDATLSGTKENYLTLVWER